jgi:pyruvate kinase
MIKKIKKILGKNLPERKTKIICTIGPATSKESDLKKLIEEGMDFARFNFSHGSFEEFKKWADTIRRLAKKVGRKVEIIQDLQGPRIRIGKIDHEGRHIDAGSTVHLVFGDKSEHHRDILIQNDVQFTLKRGDKILMDKGLIELEVKKVEGTRVTCRALTAGIIFSGKGINLPNTKSEECLTEKDLEDLKHGIEIDVDWVALSFVEEKQDILDLREKIGPKTKIIAKIERPQAIHNYEEILDASDAIMVARGDLGIEIPFWTLPVIQKRAIRRAINAGKPSIVATDMLASMVIARRPTRAEVLDVANAVLDGASAVMLSDETAVGKYPIDALISMRKIVEETEHFAQGQALKSLLG